MSRAVSSQQPKLPTSRGSFQITWVTGLEEMTRLRVAGVPLEHVLGWVEFCGLRIAVEPGVFVPRRRTGLIARQAVTLAAPGRIAVELCCGAGAVAEGVDEEVVC